MTEKPKPRTFVRLDGEPNIEGYDIGEIDAYLSSGDEVKRFEADTYWDGGEPVRRTCVLAADHERIRVQDREFTERLVDWIKIAAAGCADGSYSLLVANTLLIEWEERNE